MNITNNQTHKTIPEVQRVVWFITAIVILIAISFLTNYLLSLAAKSGFTHPAPYLAGLMSFFVGAILMVKAPGIWEKKRLFELRGFGPNYWVWVVWSLSLCWLVYLLYIAKILPDPAIKLGAFLTLITEGIFSASLSFGVALSILLVFDEHFQDVVNSFCPILQKTELQNFDIAQAVISRLKEEPYNIPDDAKLISTSWDTGEEKFNLVMEWVVSVYSDAGRKGSPDENTKSKASRVLKKITVSTSPLGDVLDTVISQEKQSDDSK